ncbi:type 1 glutamine amidotransferase domain-containing protein [Haloferacaceae archaeon DSL9]
MRALVITGQEFEDTELAYPVYRLREANVETIIATPGGDDVAGKHGIEFEADADVGDFEPTVAADDFDLLVVPGGRAPESIRQRAPVAADIIAAFDDAEKPIASICHGAQLLISAEIVDGRELTAYQALAVDVENAGGTFVDEEVVVDGNLVTSRVPDDLPALMRETFGLLDEIEAPAGS